MRDGKIVMLYRAQDLHGTSRLGYAESQDGVHFTRRPEPVFSPETDYEKDGGVEDPRLVQFGDTYYLTYTGYNKKDAQLCLATSKDLVHWQRQGVILPAYKGNWNTRWTKSGAIIPEKIAGKYWMYFLGTARDNTDQIEKDQIGLASSTDLLHWTEATNSPVLPVRPGKFDSRVAERHAKGNFPYLQRGRRQTRIPYRYRYVRPQRSEHPGLTYRRPNFLSRETLGKNRSGSQCRLRGRHDQAGQPLPLLLRRCRCQHRRSRSPRSSAVAVKMSGEKLAMRARHASSLKM